MWAIFLLFSDETIDDDKHELCAAGSDVHVWNLSCAFFSIMLIHLLSNLGARAAYFGLGTPDVGCISEIRLKGLHLEC